jgi:DNA-binding NtrC family response regulator
MATLAAHRWQGNVRELRNMVEAMMAMGELPRLSVSGIEAATAATAEPAKLADAVRPLLTEPYKRARSAVLDEFEKCYLAHILESSGGNVAKAARDAMMDRSHLIELLQKHRLR